MNIYPAIDLYQGKVVRLSRGDFQAETVYSNDPAAQARDWENQGSQWIHVVDLEGAKTGELRNFASLVAIRKNVRCKIQFGGGLRDIKHVECVLNEGIDRIVVGTKALDDAFFTNLLDRFGSRVAVSLDTREGRVQTEGWLKESGQTIQRVLEKLNKSALETVIYTDISKDGMLQGPNLEGLRKVLSWSRAKVILSGGVSTLEDIEKCSQISEKNFEGVIVGKALYEKRFELRTALSHYAPPENPVS
ncbi:MAG TPA: 1-(5-phosphoribosyl)-5-[(5-phosphoribosylamino)methylideneamino]imidazole-4-carboxamide isomerase [Verrucomicrobiae bacterium]|jgi:phosphoribosylformimino-5-aminoimidazole carboxamide ribotide isomerase|nr:1-(5-phosphoribosyl)-5-[(5-phosphoribosylamino)methylideneamino]imidazole-4-carboxamide isomerase [Verrucomicrobiae bacterium]